MTIPELAVQTLLTDTSLSVGGVFTAAGGSPITCRVYVRRMDPEIHTGRTMMSNPSIEVILARREITERPRKDDQLQVLEGDFAGTYVVHAVHEFRRSPAWRVNVGKPPA